MIDLNDESGMTPEQIAVRRRIEEALIPALAMYLVRKAREQAEAQTQEDVAA